MKRLYFFMSLLQRAYIKKETTALRDGLQHITIKKVFRRKITYIQKGKV